jgi:RimJ/RimL family protein N-acetyltransferase
VAHWYVSAEADQSQTPAVDYALMAHQKAAHWAAHGFGQWLVWDGPRAVARGGLHLLALNGRYEADVGFAVLPEAQGRGVASALGLAACDLASAIGLREVVAAVRVDNRRAGWIAESIGFVPEAEIERFGHPYVLYRRPIT